MPFGLVVLNWEAFGNIRGIFCCQNDWEVLLGDNSLQASQLSESLTETLTTFVSDHLIKDVCISNSLGRWRQCLLLGQMAVLLIVQYNKEMSTSGTKVRQVSLLPIWEDLCFRSLRFFSYDTSCTQTGATSSEAPLCWLHGPWEQGELMQTRTSGCLLCN